MKICTACKGKKTFTSTYSVPVGNLYSYNYELRQDYERVTETRKCSVCNGKGRI